MKVEMKEEEPSIGSPTHPPEPGSAPDIAVKLEDAAPSISNSQAARAPSDPIIPSFNPLTSALDNPNTAGGRPVTSPAPITSPTTRPSSHVRQQHVPAPAQPPAPAPAADPFTPHTEKFAQDFTKFVENLDRGFEVSSSEFRSVVRLTSATQDSTWELWAESLEKKYAGPSVSGSEFRMEKGDVAIWIGLRAVFKILATAAPSWALSQAARQSNAEQEITDESVENGDHRESQVAGPADADGEDEYQPVNEGDHLTWKRRHNNKTIIFRRWCLDRNRLIQFDKEIAEEDKKKKADAP